MSNGNAGSRNQAHALAKALAPDPIEVRVRVAWPFSWIPPRFFPLAGAGRSTGGRVEGPWPDVLISCGRRAGLVAQAIQRASKGRTLTVHIEKPPGQISAFDRVIAMPHDDVRGPNVLCVDTALHGITEGSIRAAAEGWRERFGRFPGPITGVLLGGPTRRAPFAMADLTRLLDDLERRREVHGGSLLISPSRRTPPALVAAIAQRHGDDPSVFLWEGETPNPYQAILGWADRLVVTGDSVSMISEALATIAPVSVFDVGGGRRHRRFLDGLLRNRLVGLSSDPEDVVRPAPLNATPSAADFVRELLGERLKERR